MKKSITYLAFLILFLLIGIIFFVLNSSNNQVKDSSSSTQLQSVKRVMVSEFVEKINSKNENTYILDIRTPEEFAIGRIEGSINIDYYKSNFKSELAKLDKNKEYLIYCNSGNRSLNALKIMKEMGFKNVYELNGGIQAWKSQNLPVCTTC